MINKKKDKAEIYKRNIPTILVIFGVTGDLTRKKAIPALFHLFVKGQLPRMFRLIGFSRRDIPQKDFRKYVEEIIVKHFGNKTDKRRLKNFLEFLEYRRGRFGKGSDYKELAKTLKAVDDNWGVCANKLFYLAVPPKLYETIFTHLAASELTKPCGPNEGWTRVIIEKPFGNNEKSAKALDKRLSQLFKEEQIYRIDHYLAKEMFQNILAFRFFNNLFEDRWGKDLIETIYAREWENIGVEHRGAFYDAVGALRDVGQNHLLQMAALTTMDQPENLTAESIRKKRADILKTFIPPTTQDVKRNTFRAQYEGYGSIKGVKRHSDTETYFRAKAFLSHPKWQGVPIIMEAGKRLLPPKKKEEITEIEVVFRHPQPCLCASLSEEGAAGRHYKNSLIFRQDPKEGITIRFWSKKPGHVLKIEERTFEFNLRDTNSTGQKAQYTEEYEKLLLDCIAGDQTLFVSSGEVVSSWRFIDPIITAWDKGVVPLKHYKPDSLDITKEAADYVTAATNSFLEIKKEIGIIGLGKMGANLSRQLHARGWKVFAWNRNGAIAKELENNGVLRATATTEELLAKLSAPRIVWLMLPAFAKATAGKPAGKPVDEFLFGKSGIVKYLRKGDIVIDGGNSFYADSVRRAKKLKDLGINFLDIGVSGGPSGALNGACLMIGGERKIYSRLEVLFNDLSVENGYGYMGKAGAGHFVKMVHNGMEYGMMQSLAEGFAVLKKSPFKLNLREVAEVYNHGSVITSRLVGWLKNGLEAYGENLKSVSGSVAHTGEGEWTVKTAKKLNVPTPIIKASFDFRKASFKQPSYIGKLLSVLRNQFGGHSIKK
ncbi:MAG: glucose-6-phosphate dehydrogenase [Patescibacteria group bacterium]|nr:glucose-6-phosphate dehydrogenase [Patescibacteria group bacterium]